MRDTETVNRNWSTGSDFDAELVRASIESLTSAGLRLHTGELVCWAFTSPVGTINGLRTEEAYQKRGYAQLIMRRMARENAKLGLHSVCHVLPGNTASAKLMEKLGFVHSHNMTWTQYIPPLNTQSAYS